MPSKDFELDRHIKASLNSMLVEIQTAEKADCVLISGPILFGLDDNLRDAIEGIDKRSKRLVAIIDTPGGIVEVVERMVETIRYHYKDVEFVIPDRAMSAGTILVMSGDKIRMDHFSRLGPIDPQVEKDGKLVPALSYLIQYQRLITKAQNGTLTDAELLYLPTWTLQNCTSTSKPEGFHTHFSKAGLPHTSLKIGKLLIHENSR